MTEDHRKMFESKTVAELLKAMENSLGSSRILESHWKPLLFNFNHWKSLNTMENHHCMPARSPGTRLKKSLETIEKDWKFIENQWPLILPWPPFEKIEKPNFFPHLTARISQHSSHTTHPPPVISYHSSHTAPLPPVTPHHSHLIPFISHYSSHGFHRATNHLTQFISHQSSHIIHLTPLISHQSSHSTQTYITHLTPLISQHSNMYTLLILHHSSHTKRIFRWKTQNFTCGVIRSFFSIIFISFEEICKWKVASCWLRSFSLQRCATCGAPAKPFVARIKRIYTKPLKSWSKRRRTGWTWALWPAQKKMKRWHLLCWVFLVGHVSSFFGMKRSSSMFIKSIKTHQLRPRQDEHWKRTSDWTQSLSPGSNAFLCHRIVLLFHLHYLGLGLSCIMLLIRSMCSHEFFFRVINRIEREKTLVYHTSYCIWTSSNPDWKLWKKNNFLWTKIPWWGGLAVFRQDGSIHDHRPSPRSQDLEYQFFLLPTLIWLYVFIFMFIYLIKSNLYYFLKKLYFYISDLISYIWSDLVNLLYTDCIYFVFYLVDPFWSTLISRSNSNSI